MQILYRKVAWYLSFSVLFLVVPKAVMQFVTPCISSVVKIFVIRIKQKLMNLSHVKVGEKGKDGRENGQQPL